MTDMDRGTPDRDRYLSSEHAEDGSVSKRGGVGIGLLFPALIAASVLGTGWQGLEAHGAREESEQLRSEAERVSGQLSLSRALNRLGEATLRAHAGDLESSRYLSSAFFRQLQTYHVDFPDEAPHVVASVLDARDDVITTLARSQPDAADRLSMIYVQLQSAADPEGSAEMQTAMTTGALGGNQWTPGLSPQQVGEARPAHDASGEHEASADSTGGATAAQKANR